VKNKKIVKFFLPKKYQGGMEISNQKLMDYFDVKFNFDVEAFVIKGGRNKESYFVGAESSCGILAMYYQLLKSNNTELLVLNGVVPLILALLTPRKLNLVYQVHCTVNKNDDLSWTKKKVLNILIGFASWRFSVHCVSQGLAKEIALNKIVRNKSVSFNPNVMNLSMKEGNNTNNKTNTLSFIGRYSSQKDPVMALDVFKAYSLIHSDVKCQFIGGGELEVDLKNDAKGLFDFIEWKSNPFTSSEFLIFTSRYEGYGLVIIEAICEGVLVVARDVPHGPSEILKSIDSDMLLDADADVEQYVTRIDFLKCKYSLQENVDILRRKTCEYLEGLEETRLQVWNSYL
jgi:glycosyltransferase involved in cell wall biosynthesis